jgi:GntR family transcriptional regulator
VTNSQDGPTPHRYQEIASELRTAIERGDHPDGSRLPSENDIVRDYNVARNTARDALAVLKREGLAVARQGSGTTVNRPAGRDTTRPIGIPDELWDAAREKARLNSESIDQVVRRALTQYVSDD